MTSKILRKTEGSHILLTIFCVPFLCAVSNTQIEQKGLSAYSLCDAGLTPPPAIGWLNIPRSCPFMSLLWHVSNLSLL